jgi:PPK2 family polyphosphate:nucleotide phosphotransferase
MKLAKLVKPYQIAKGRRFRLKDIDPGDTLGLDLDPKTAKELLQAGIERLAELQELLYADNRWSLLIIFQAMDAAGKDSAIKHVMSGVNPQGCRVYSFKAPSEEDLRHDYMWRSVARLPESGYIGIFNRSYYEETLVVRVHREMLDRQHLPESLVGPKIWKQRFEDINAIERFWARNGIITCKFFLHVSKAEQRRRFLKRLEEPDKHWKFSTHDLAERQHWDEYAAAYQEMICATAKPEAPWHIVPADNKWFSRLVVAAAIIDRLEDLGLKYPKPDGAMVRQLRAAKRALTRA